MTAASVSSLPRVAESEKTLLELTRAILRPSSSHIRRLRIRAESDRRLSKIGPTAMGLLQQTLTAGVSYELLHRGGWQRRRTLVEGHPRGGRLWQRHTSLPVLEFGPASFELLLWLHDEDVGLPKRKLKYKGERGLGDELLHYLAAEQVLAAGGNLLQPGFLHSPLCQLGFADALSGGELPTLDFRPLARGGGAIVLEALQSDLARKWLAMESTKQTITELDDMIAFGRAQDRVLAGLFRAVDLVEPRRRELCGFLAEFAIDLLAPPPMRRRRDIRFWIASLDMRATLSARQAAFKGAMAGVRAVLQLERWLDEAGVVAHFDEDYEAAQLLLSTWAPLRRAPAPLHRDPSLPPEPLTIFERAHALVHELESLHSLGAPPSSSP